MDSWNATRTRHHLQASFHKILLEIKKSLSELWMMGRVSMLRGRIVGVEYSGEGGGGPVYMACKVLILLPAR
jgi:hypothetical protein